MQRATAFDRVWQDLKYTARRLRREPGSGAVAIVTIGLAVGLTTAIYSVAASVLLRPLPYKNPDRLVAVWKTIRDVDIVPLPVPEFFDLKARAKSLQDLAAIDRDGFALIAPGVAEWADAFRVTPNLFDLLGVRPIVGRTFLPDEDQPGHEKVVVLAEGFWRRVFGSDPGIVGKYVRLAGRGSDATGTDRYEVLGVVSSSVRLFYRLPLRADLYVPRVITAAERGEKARGALSMIVFGRLRPDTTVGEADAEVRTLMAAFAREHPAVPLPPGSARVVALHEELVGQARPTLLLLAAGAGLVLLIGCANVANLLLASGLRRTPEISIRLAIGCSERRLLQQLLTEHLLLALCGGTLGVLLAAWATPLLAHLAPGSLPRVDQTRIDLGVLGFGLVVSVLAGLTFGAVPAWILARPRLADFLKVGVGAVRAQTRWLRGGLVVAETALVLVLLAGAGLIAKGLWRLAHLELGFNPTDVLVAEILLPDRWETLDRSVAFERDLLARVRRLPGVIRAATSDELPFAWGALNSVTLAGSNESHPSMVSAVDADYLPLLEVPLREGRMFGRQDEGKRAVALVNETLVERFVPRGQAIGQRILVAKEWREIVGVVGDITEVGQIRGEYIRQAGFTRLTLPAVYVPTGTAFGAFQLLLVRTALAPPLMVQAIRGQLRAIDPEVTIRRTSTLDELVAKAGADTRFQALLIGTFAGAALVLAAVGLYGVLAHAVNQRTREIGIRVALGAGPGRVRWMVAGQALALVGTGAGIGLGVALAAGRAIRSFLFEVAPTDPPTFAAVIILLLLVALIAAYVPARRATRVDPARALRCE